MLLMTPEILTISMLKNNQKKIKFVSMENFWKCI